MLGEALKGRRDKAIISTRATFRFDDEPNRYGYPRYVANQTDYSLIGRDYD